MKEKIKKLAEKVFYPLYYVCASVRIRLLYHWEHSFGRLRYLSEEDLKIWLRAMLALLKTHCAACYGFGTKVVHERFATADIKTVRVRPYENTQLPLVVLCVRNDRKRLEMLVNHYRTLGVERFAFIDNGSSDGTFEWMLEQSDIDIFKTADEYSALAKEAWLNRVVSHYGFDRWVILTDSDELFTYIGMEEHPIRDLIAYAEANGLVRFKGINLDMYADAPLFSPTEENGEIQAEYCWMDSDSYVEEKRLVAGTEITAVIGGPRLRSMGVPASIMKYPLLYFERGTVSSNAHFQFPYTLAEASPCCIGILHYKFFGSDRKEFERRANFSSGIKNGFIRTGEYYRQYLKNCGENTSFMYEGSVRYENSASLKAIPMIKEIPFD